MRQLYIPFPLLLLVHACMQDPEAPHNQPDTPTLSVDEASVTRVSMLVNGSFGHDLTDITSYGVELSTTLFESGEEVQTLTPQEVGPDGYALGVSGLSPNETYYLRAFISNGHSKMYSSVITQKTPETSVASVSDVSLSADGTYMTASLEDNGGRSVEEVGFVWGSTNDRRALRREKRYPATLSNDGKSFKLPMSYIGKGTHYVLAYAEDNKEATGFSRIALERIVRDDEPLPEFQPANEIWYTSTDGNVVELTNAQAFDAAVVSNTYENGKGIIRFDGPVTIMSASPFSDNSGNTIKLQSISFPESLQTFKDGFDSLEYLETIHFPSHLASVPGYLVAYIDSIKELEFPETDKICETYSNGPIGFCRSLEKLTGPYASADNRALIKGTKLFAFAGAGISSYSIPSGITCVGGDAFSGYENLEQVTLPASVDSIGYLSFCRTGIKQIELPAALSYISSSAFSQTPLTTITIPDGAEIESNVFNACESLESFHGRYATEDGRCLIKETELYAFAPAGLTEYSIPEGVTSITSGFTEGNGIPALTLPSSLSVIWFLRGSAFKTITCQAVTPPTVKYSWSLRFPNLEAIYVPAESVESYKSAEHWSAFADYIQAIPSDWKPNHYLTFTSEGTTKLSLTNHYNNAPVLYHSTDETNWAEWDYSELTFSSDAPVYICGDNPDGFNIDINTYSNFSSAGDPFSVSGDIMSLINNQESVTVIPKEGCFRGLFFGTNIVSPPSLPATTLAYGCYYQMFYACPNLATAPELPATTMAVGCYWEMFRGCTSLTTPPALPATSMEGGCYRDMFYGCSSLKTAPELPATKLASSCYNAMFFGCSSLTSPPELPATIMEKGCYANMFYGCSSLASAPDLPSTSLAEDCYASMFSGCSLLTSAPSVLPATTLAPRCYSDMFYDCIKLAIAPELPALTMADYCYRRMFCRCSSLTEAPSLPATAVAEGCYYEMFCWCTGLRAAPSLPATALAKACYKSMFNMCTDLTIAPQLPATTLADNCYESMFMSCSNLVSAPDLPATTMANSCYAHMFHGCSALSSAPELPATDLNASCYDSMFCYCSSLLSAPELPAISLANYCYENMFTYCSELTTAPVLPAATLTPYCYYKLFMGCEKLNYVKCLATDVSAGNSLGGWLERVSTTGTFVKAASMNDWPSGVNGIPEGWTISNDSDTPSGGNEGTGEEDWD